MGHIVVVAVAAAAVGAAAAAGSEGREQVEERWRGRWWWEGGFDSEAEEGQVGGEEDPRGNERRPGTTACSASSESESGQYMEAQC